MKIPGFTAEWSLRNSHEQYRLIAQEAQEAGKGSVIPQFCTCIARATFSCVAEPGGYLRCDWGPPYHYYCYGSSCWRPKFGVNPIGG
jgi:hypothetical protein